MLASWPTRDWHAQRGSEPGEMARMLSLLAVLADKDLASGLIAKLIDQRGHDKSDNEAILETAGLYPLDRAADLLRRILMAHAVEALGACSALLAGAVRARFATKPGKLIGSLEALIDALPGDPSLAPKDQYGRPISSNPEAGFVVDLVGVVDVVAPDLAKRAAQHILAWPGHFGLDNILVPAMLRLVETGGATAGDAFGLLHAAGLAHLKRRAAEPLEAPKDWLRVSGVRCTCAHCTALVRFLGDAGSATWSLKAAQPIRSHVETTIANARCDLDTRTERRGTPHSLVCTKNQASYERRVAQRKQDLADIKTLSR